MTRLLRDFRLVPIVLVAAGGLLLLKMLGIIFDGGYTLNNPEFQAPAQVSTAPASTRGAPAGQAAGATKARQSWAQEMFGFPAADASRAEAPPRRALVARENAPASEPLITGSLADEKKGAESSKKMEAGEKDAAAPGKPKPIEPKKVPDGTPVDLANNRPRSLAERAVLERLRERRLQLEVRERELEIRENLLKATEKRVETRVNELKTLEAQGGESAQRREENNAASRKNLATMYENMKAKDAARIFDRLDIKVLIDVASQINPRRMSDILGQMSAEAAERLTMEMATRGGIGEKSPMQPELPKIEGRPTGG